MAYLEPPVFARKVFNKIAMKTGIAGSQTLVCRSRRSGGQQRIPVIPVQVDGALYVVSARGESQWVRNVRAHPSVTLETKGAQSHYQAQELPPADSGEVIAAYRAKAGRTVEGYWKQLPEHSDHPTFKLVPASMG